MEEEEGGSLPAVYMARPSLLLFFQKEWLNLDMYIRPSTRKSRRHNLPLACDGEV
ncbi:hypothetical protein GUITHDRAFT_151415 [Guillardia theta CCMP2712]|uniref:Uncharacterized protein n=1 Tax=Guillardia theta (strain CCMP2712) TaxID=905079 RepID=L1JMW3_GUITC|nr:hypothetical protein GUITHDRAFT_151415 [Guillardia theta CCMP2712]EKX49619.1 hypothetical protein GUITHDRAFT_151415 [Guillardia theta CCMP2712]|eukprot:XP_005836599.1 hypothetical protein GUITHDRAFT_151415 [Guillardia theta CCMP2712]